MTYLETNKVQIVFQTNFKSVFTGETYFEIDFDSHTEETVSTLFKAVTLRASLGSPTECYFARDEMTEG